MEFCIGLRKDFEELIDKYEKSVERLCRVPFDRRRSMLSCITNSVADDAERKILNYLPTPFY